MSKSRTPSKQESRFYPGELDQLVKYFSEVKAIKAKMDNNQAISSEEVQKASSFQEKYELLQCLYKDMFDFEVYPALLDKAKDTLRFAKNFKSAFQKSFDQYLTKQLGQLFFIENLSQSLRGLTVAEFKQNYSLQISMSSCLNGLTIESFLQPTVLDAKTSAQFIYQKLSITPTPGMHTVTHQLSELKITTSTVAPLSITSTPSSQPTPPNSPVSPEEPPLKKRKTF